jgi:hypothetical protein
VEARKTTSIAWHHFFTSLYRKKFNERFFSHIFERSASGTEALAGVNSKRTIYAKKRNLVPEIGLGRLAQYESLLRSSCSASSLVHFSIFPQYHTPNHAEQIQHHTSFLAHTLCFSRTRLGSRVGNYSRPDSPLSIL